MLNPSRWVARLTTVGAALSLAGLDGLLGTGDDVCTDINQISLFSNVDLSYYWSYDNEGLKIAQLRFYEVPTAVSF